MTHNAPENTRKARSLAVPVGAGSLAALTALGFLPSAIAVGNEAETTSDTQTSVTEYKSTEREIPNTGSVTSKISDAEKAGVKVTQNDPVSTNVSLSEADQAVKDAEARNKEQITKLDDAIKLQETYDSQYAGEVAARNTIIEQNKTIDATNANAQAARDAAVEAQKKVEEANKKIDAQRKEIQASNDQGLKDALAKHDAYVDALKVWKERTQAIMDANAKTNDANNKKLAGAAKAVSDAKTDAEREKAVTAYDKLVAEINLENEKIEAENDAKLEKYNADLKKATEARDNALKALAEVQAGNAAKRTQFEADMKAYEEAQAAYQAKVDAVKKAIAEGKCEVPSVAFVLDMSRSFENSEVEEMKNQIRQSIERLSEANGTVNVAFFTFGYGSPVDFVDANRVPHDGNIAAMKQTDTYRQLPNNNPSARFDVSTADGKTAALEWLAKIDKHSIDYPRSMDGQPLPDGINLMTLGTNWEAGLEAVEKYQVDNGQKFTSIVLMSDGAPNGNVNPDGTVTIGVDTDDPFLLSAWSNQRAIDETKDVVKRIEATGVDVVPVVIRDEAVNMPGTDYHFANSQDAMNTVASQLAGVDNAVVGKDYFVGDMSGLSNEVYNAVVSSAAQCIVADSKPPKPNEPTYEDENVKIPGLPTPPELKDSAAVTPLTTSPTEPSEFIPDPLPDFLPVPPVPEYNPVPKLTVPAEPVKKQAEVAVELSKVFVDPSDVRIDKVLVDSDASDGQVQYKVTVGNFGPGTAHQVAAEDFKFEGLKDVKISDVKSIADVTAETVEEVAAASDVAVDSARLMVTDPALAQNEGFSFIVTAQVEENVDVIANAARVTTPDDPEKGKEDGDPNANLTEDNDGFDNERQRIQGPVEVKVDKTLTDSDASDGYVEYTVTGKNVGPGIAKDVVVTDEPGAGIESIEITGVQVTPSGAKDAVTIDVPASESTDAPTDPSVSPSADPSAEPTAKSSPTATAEPSAEPSSVAGTVNKGATTQPVAPVVAAAGDSSGVAGVAQGAEVSVAIPGFVDKAKVDIKGITGVGPVKAAWNGDGFLTISAAADADLGDAVIAYSLTLPDGSVTEASMTVTVVGANDSGIVVNPPAVPSADPSATPETGAPETSDSLVNTDVTDVSDVTVTENGVTIGAMGAGEVVTLTVRAKVADNVDTIDNVARITTPSDPTKGEDGEPNATVDEDTDGYDRDRNKVKRPADLRINKQVVDADASDGYIDYVIEGANFGPGIAEQVVITDETVTGLDGVEITGVEVIPAENLVAQPSVDELGVVSTDVSVVDDYTIDGSTVAIDAMGAGERVKVSVTAKVTEGAELVENDARITSPSDPTKGEGDQTNNSVDDDEDGFDKELTNIDQPVDLRVVKTAVDDNAEDGQVTFEVEGKNFGTGTATEVVVEDLASDVKNLEDLKISNVVVSDNTDFTVDGTSVKLPALAGGQSVRFTVTADVVDATQEMSNSASITSPDSDKTRNDQDNGTLEEDQDGWDVVSIPGVPAPETPADPENPADPVDPADPGAPADPAQPSSEAPVKGTWGTGAGGVAGIGLGAAALVAFGAYAVSRFRGRSAE